MHIDPRYITTEVCIITVHIFPQYENWTDIAHYLAVDVDILGHLLKY